MAPYPFPNLLIKAFHTCIGSSIRWLCTLETFHTSRIPPCHPAGGAQRLRHFPSSYQAWCLRQDGIWGLHPTLVEVQSKMWNKHLTISPPRTRCEAGMSQLGKPMRSRLAHRLSRGRERKGLFGFLSYRKIYCSHGKACEALELLSFWLGRQSSWKTEFLKEDRLLLLWRSEPSFHPLFWMALTFHRSSWWAAWLWPWGGQKLPVAQSQA